MRTITDIKVWINKERTEMRVYVTYSDKSEGTYYKTGNHFQAKGSLVNMTEQERHEAFEICEKFHGTKGWKSVRFYELNPSTSTSKVDEEDADVKSRGFRESRTPDFEQCFA